ncbi:hypothetical protein DQ04_01641110 [Trypanosoma grayi]|uniref:hypothetical protein n=1 Tax=Trypanosoma grayi TaxID=71804 RepID=UPI0004F416AF|nr:hypothetical protein DQ04_01641110 [Trypanosoma grayi]KEG12532.1 hypothetical protein DQ04_01641110 [Trypanosoma grayi]
MMHGLTYPKVEAKQQRLPLMGTAQLPSLESSDKKNPMETGRRQRMPVVGATDSSSSSSSRGKKGRSSGRSSDRSGARSAASVETIMEMNKEAMALLRDGKKKASHDMLQAALSAAESGVRRIQRQSDASRAGVQEQRDAWLLAFATTLSNLGCVRRRDNKLHDALRYLQDAREVEAQVFGKPSCSTMVNLSAVLLGVGSAEEALRIARDCVVASEDSDPMLHIIALHNYGVTLSQHPAEDTRQSAASVLMKALRQSQSHLGEEHPTTVLIRERCGMSLRNPPQSGTVAAPQAKKTSSQAPPAGHVLPPIAPISVQRLQAKEAMQSLDYGTMPLTATSSAPSERQTASLSSLAASLKEMVGSGTMRPAPVLPPITSDSVANDTQTEPPARRSTPNVPASVSCVVAGEAQLLQKSLQMDLVPVILSTVTETCVRRGELPEGDVSDTVTVTKVEVDELEENEATVLPSDVKEILRKEEKEEEEEEEEHKSESHGERQDSEEADTFHVDALGATRRPVRNAIPGGFFVIASHSAEMQPSFLRFAPPETPASLPLEEGEAARKASACSPTTQHSSRDSKSSVKPPPSRSEREKLFTDSDEEILGKETEEGDEETSSSEKPKENMGAHVLGNIRETVVKTIGVSAVMRRAERMQKEREEEEALRSRLRQEAEEKAKKEYFERKLSFIISRTRNTAASKIQYTWLMWWNSVGKRRRELLRKREEEKARRERSRQALLDHERRVEEALRQKKRPAQAVVAVIPSVIHCGKKWLERTACVRYLARRGIPREDRNEAFFLRSVAKIQAAWRGVSTRQRVRDMLAVRAETLLLKQEIEPREYAAIVIQMFVRRVFARMTKRRNLVERYGPPTTLIQKWFRQTMLRRRALGIDRVSRWRKEYSARLIQRAWRAYLSRLAHFMALLRYQLDEDRRRERTAAKLLQRIGRGWICRQYMTRTRLRNTHYQTVTHTLKWGNDGAGTEKKDFLESASAAVVPPAAAVYVPTPVEEVEQIAQMERDKYHIGIFVDTVAAREREAWAEALRLRPFEVLRRRAHEDHLCELELNASRRERAAVKIQTEFRRWLRIRDGPWRDNTLLLISRGRYQEACYGRKVEMVRHRREQQAGREIFGEQTAPMREMRVEVQEELREVQPLVRTHVPHEEVRTRTERYTVEMELQRDELVVEQQMTSDMFGRKRESRQRRMIEASPTPQTMY